MTKKEKYRPNPGRARMLNNQILVLIGELDKATGGVDGLIDEYTKTNKKAENDGGE